MKSKQLLIYLMLIVYIASFIYIKLSYCSDHLLSLIFVINYIVSVICIWFVSNKKLTLFLLFFFTYGLFIGGRYVSNTFVPRYDPYMMTIFGDYNLTDNRKIELLHFVISFMTFSIIGYNIFKRKEINSKRLNISNEYLKYRVNNFLKSCFPVISILVIYYCLEFVWEGLQGGYLAHFVANVNAEYSGSSLARVAKMLCVISLGLAIAFGDRVQKKKYILLFFLYSLANLFVGSRGSFGALLLILLWFYSFNHKISIKKVFVGLGFGMFALLFLYSFSIRMADIDSKDLSFLETAMFFIYSQGVSLIVFDMSRLITDYPVLPYVQSFIPGASFFYLLLSGETLNVWDVSFADYMCYNLNSRLFLEGAGLGWTLTSDLYLFSGGFVLIFIVLSFVWGGIIGLLENLADKDLVYRYILVALAPSVLVIARGGIHTFFPLMVYLGLAWIILKKIILRV